MIPQPMTSPSKQRGPNGSPTPLPWNNFPSSATKSWLGLNSTCRGNAAVQTRPSFERVDKAKKKQKKHHSLLFWVTRLTPPALNQETHTAEENHSLYIHSRKAGTFPLIWKIAISSTWCCNLHRLKWIKSLSLKSESRFCNAAPTCMVSYGPSAPTWMSVFRIVLHINQDRKTSEISHQLSNSLLCLSVQQQKAKMAETHWYVYLLYHFTG